MYFALSIIKQLNKGDKQYEATMEKSHGLLYGKFIFAENGIDINTCTEKEAVEIIPAYCNIEVVKDNPGQYFFV